MKLAIHKCNQSLLSPHFFSIVSLGLKKGEAVVV